VVIAVIALLMTIVLPALSEAKRQTKDVICLSNLHQWGLIWRTYTDENNGLFPETQGCENWPDTIRQLCTKTFESKLCLCPLATRTYSDGARSPSHMAWPPQPGPNDIKSSYTINEWVANEQSNGQTQAYWKSPNVKNAAYSPLLIDGLNTHMKPYPQDRPPDWLGPHSFACAALSETGLHIAFCFLKGEMRRACIRRHRPYYVQSVFLDFSVRKLTIKQLWRVNWHRDWPADHPLPVWPDWMADVPEPDW
jgi:hypothetical protein